MAVVSLCEEVDLQRGGGVLGHNAYCSPINLVISDRHIHHVVAHHHPGPNLEHRDVIGLAQKDIGSGGDSIEHPLDSHVGQATIAGSQAATRQSDSHPGYG